MNAALPAEPEHVVHEAVGPALTPLNSVGIIGVGVNSLLAAGLFPVLLGALGQEHRLSNAGLGIVAMLELLAMGVATGLAGVYLPPKRLKLLGAAACIVLALIDLATMQAAGAAIFGLRAAAGATEGILLWITVGMIARSATPERWAAVFFTAQVIAQFAVSVLFAAWVMPRWGSAGGFGCLAVCSLASVGLACLAPGRYAGLLSDGMQSGAPPFRGWIALIASLIVAAASGAIGVYLQPFAIQAGLSPDVARTAVALSLAGQVVGGAAATALAGRVRYFHVFLVGTAVLLVCWGIFAFHTPAPVFIAANVISGFMGLILAPFLVPMTIEADPSRRAAMQSGGAQLLGSAAGPAIAALLVSDKDVRSAVVLGCALLVFGLAVIAWLHFTSRHGTAVDAASGG